MSFKIVSSFPNEILDATDAPLISLYQPTHRNKLESKQDSTRFKNLVKRIEDSLKKCFSRKEIEQITRPFHVLAEDKPFWEHALEGLAVLATRKRGVIYKLQRTVKELAVVANSFHIKPLVRIFQSADRYHLLGLSRNEFALYEGNRYGFEEVELEPGTPRTIEEIFDKEHTEKYLTSGTYAGAEGVGAFHGHGGRKEEIDKHTVRFFRYVDKFVWNNFSRSAKLPLILVALAEHHPLFQNISRNSFLMENGVKIGFDALSSAELRKSVWEKIEPLYLDKTKKLVDSFIAAQAKFLASDDLGKIARAAWDDRVATLLVEADRIIPGKVNLKTGVLTDGDLEHPAYDDVLDDLAEMVFKSKGEVVVLPAERMPSKKGAAAIFRY
jgi:hypothetical protein